MQFATVATNGKFSASLGKTSAGDFTGILSFVVRCEIYSTLMKV